MITTRLTGLAAVAAALGMFAGTASAALPNVPPQLEFTMLRNGDEVGHHVMQFHRQGDTLSVAIATDVVVTVAFVPVYRCEHRGSETWSGDHLVSLATQTNDDGTKHTLKVRAEGNGLDVDGDGHDTRAVADIVPASLWNPRLTAQSVLLNTLDGSQMPVAVKDAGEETVQAHHASVRAHHYVVTGALNRELWYDEGGTLVRIRFKAKDGSDIVYELR